MDITATATVILSILGHVRKLFSTKKSKNLPRGGVHRPVTQDADGSGIGVQIVQVGGDATVAVHSSSTEDDSPTPLPKGAACPHLKPEFLGSGQYKAVGFWKWAKGYADMSVQGGNTAGTRECGFDCGKLASGLLPNCVHEANENSINFYCIDGDPLQPSKELMDFWRSRKLLH